mmetsp:Transcript_43823/g.137668  ORF Transcript_43823/g.137668 Transcript_43823/m.137668 type:complete len:189 (-) Transcript_43823:1007-1573(-)
MENYQEAYEIHMSDNQPQKAHKWLEKVGDNALKAEDKKKAGEIYEAMGDFCLTETRLQQMNAKNWYMKAYLCFMAMDSVLGTAKGEEYLNKDYNLAESREGELMASVNGAVEALDEVAFTEAVNVYNRVGRLSPEMVTLLLEIREPIEAAADTAGPTEEEDVPDLDNLQIDAADDDVAVDEDGELDLT